MNIFYLLSAFMLLMPYRAEAQWQSGKVVSAAYAEELMTKEAFRASTIDDATFERMRRGGSFPKECTVPRENLRYLRVLHYNFDGEVQTGELICNKTVADDFLNIFRELYVAKYQIARMVLIDDYGANDEASMSANNTSAFCFRKVNGSARLSKHAQGLAIDINPLQNPCVKYSKNGTVLKVEPNTHEARKHIKRSAKSAHLILKGDLCHSLFVKHGFRWGGSWRSKKDYQHFEK